MLKADGVRPPRQGRSEATFERLLVAAEQLFAERGIDNVTMAAVAERADSSIGALYTRVPDRTALVRAVQLRILARPHAVFLALAERHRAEGGSLAEVVGELIDVVLGIVAQHAGAVRALVVQGVRDPVMRERAALVLEDATDGLTRLLERHAAEIAHPDPPVAADVIVRTLTGLVQQAIILDRPIDPGRASAELRTLVLGYLGAEAQNRSGNSA